MVRLGSLFSLFVVAFPVWGLPTGVLGQGVWMKEAWVLCSKALVSRSGGGGGAEPRNGPETPVAE